MFENYPTAFCVAVFIFSPPPFVPPPERGILVGGFVVPRRGIWVGGVLIKKGKKNAQPLACKLMNQMRRNVSAEAVGTRLDRFRHCFISAGRTEAPFILKSFLFKGP